MKMHSLIIAAVCTAALFHPLVLRAQVPSGSEPAAAPSAPLLSPDQLQELVGRVALYPDDLLALVLAASTTPLDVVKGQRFLAKYEKDKKLKPDPTIPEPVLNLMTYPDVVVLMADDLDWTEALGQAVQTQQLDTLQAIQAFRRKAEAAGNLKSDDKQKIIVQQDVVQIAPAQPDTIYVPQYQPTAVVTQQAAPAVTYVETAYPTYYRPVAAATAGFVAGAATAYGLNWATGSVYNAAGPVQAAYWQDQRQDYANEARDSWQDYGKGRQEDWQNYSKDAQAQRQQATSQNQAARQQTASSNQSQRQSTAQQGQAQRQNAAQGQRPQGTAGAGQAARSMPAGAQNWQAAGQNRKATGPGERPAGASERPAGAANRAAQTPAAGRATADRPGDAGQFGGRQAAGASSSAFGGGSGAQARTQSERGAQSVSSMNRSSSGGGARSAASGGSTGARSAPSGGSARTAPSGGGSRSAPSGGGRTGGGGGRGGGGRGR